MADRHLAVSKQWRTGKGVWYALVEILHWKEDGSGETIGQFYERCTGKEQAIEAGRRLLAEHGSKFSDEITVEGQLLTELEWKRLVKLEPEDLNKQTGHSAPS